MSTQSKEWYKYTLFVSSTFKDMNAERDAIKFDVVNRLNWHYRSQRVQFQVVDLRIGINTEEVSEEESEDMVLDVCLYNIEKSRPFFICLLGDRYGWIPSEKRWKAIVSRLSYEKRKLLSGSRGRSVTEMEILYGAIGNEGQYMNHSLFFFRNKSSYDGMPKELLSIYQDDDSLQNYETQFNTSLRLSNLKRKISDLAWENDMDDLCSEYSLKWNCITGSFDGVDKFADLVYQKLCHEIDLEIKANTPPQKWQQQEKISIDYLIDNYTSEKVVLDKVKEIIDSVYDEKQILITGTQGCGKSVAFSHIAKEIMTKEELFCLIAFIGTTSHSQQMREIVMRWITEIEIFLKLTETDEKLMAELDTNKLYQILTKLLCEIGNRGLRAVVMVDGIDRLANIAPDDIYLSWLPENIAFVGTASTATSEIMLHHQEMKCQNLDIESEGDLRNIINSQEQRFNIELPVKIKNDIMRQQFLPIQIDLLMRVFYSFTSTNYAMIKNIHEDSDISKINHYMEQVYQEANTNNLGDQFSYTIHFILKSLNAENQLLPVLEFIALSGAGLNEDDLSILLGDEWDNLRFHKLMAMLPDYFLEDMNSHRWNYRNMVFRAAMMPKAEKRKKLYTKLAQLLLGYDNDEQQKQDLLFFCLVESENSNLGRELLTSTEFNQKHAKGNWYEISLLYLLQDLEVATHIKKICENYSSSEKVGFVYNLYLSVTQYTQLSLFCQIEADVLQTIDVEELEDVDCYYLATFYGHLFQTHKVSFHDALQLRQGDVNKKKYYLEKSISAYKHCLKLNPHKTNARQMLKAMMSEMLPFLMEEKDDFEKIEEYYSEINKL